MPDIHLPPISKTSDVIEQLLLDGLLTEPPRANIRALLDRFEIHRLLGQGAEGLVFLARDPSRDEFVAIKALLPARLGDRRARQRFQDETETLDALTALQHENIVPLLESAAHAPYPYYVLRYMAGGSLAERLRGGPLDSAAVAKVAVQIARALAAAHHQTIVHRDLKPSNVLLDDRGQVSVSDFGMGLDLDRLSTVRPGDGAIVGTAHYMAPEVALGQKGNTPCDIYGLGAVMYEMLTGQPPYRGTFQEVLPQVIAGPPCSVLSVNRQASPELARICEGAMARELRERFATMTDLITDLERFLAGQSPHGPRGQTFSFVRIGRTAMISAAVVITTGLFWLTSMRPRQSAPAPSEPPITSGSLTESASRQYTAARLMFFAPGEHEPYADLGFGAAHEFREELPADVIQSHSRVRAEIEMTQPSTGTWLIVLPSGRIEVERATASARSNVVRWPTNTAQDFALDDQTGALAMVYVPRSVLSAESLTIQGDSLPNWSGQLLDSVWRFNGMNWREAQRGYVDVPDLPAPLPALAKFLERAGPQARAIVVPIQSISQAKP